MPNRADAVRAIIFDLGNVLINFDHRIAAAKIARFSAKSLQEIFDLFFDSELTKTFEEGKILPEEFFSRVKEELALALDYDKFLPLWNDIFFLTPQNRAVYVLAKTLNRRYKVALLSNINILHYQYLRKEFAVFDAFHKVFTSFELGSVKPNPLVYQKALDTLGVPAENTFYTDDRKELVEGAKGLIKKSFVFTGIEQLKTDLESCGVITS